MMYRKIKKAEAEKIDKNIRHTHPNTVWKDLIDLIGRISAQKFLHGAGFNKERDAFIACMFAYAIREYMDAECYIQQINDPPDFALLLPTERPTKAKPFDFAQIEIIQITEAVDKEVDKLAYVIKILLNTKLSNYAPGPGTMLLIFLNSISAPEVHSLFSEWYHENMDLFKNFGEVFVFYINSVDDVNSFIYTVSSLTKDWTCTQNLVEEFNRKGRENSLLQKYGVIVE